ncbi:hypothetical protein RUM44_012409 [Polyplax serrata]|uniref:Uncharacterized protein n=1 Tax=Polyplax serrata TaxID=468196 RepID=A0ABR1BF47_POLSC
MEGRKVLSKGSETRKPSKEIKKESILEIKSDGKGEEEGYKKKITTTLGDHLRLRTGLALFLGGNGGAEPGAPNTRPDDLANYGLQPLALRPHQPLLVHGGCPIEPENLKNQKCHLIRKEVPCCHTLCRWYNMTTTVCGPPRLCARVGKSTGVEKPLQQLGLIKHLAIEGGVQKEQLPPSDQDTSRTGRHIEGMPTQFAPKKSRY